MPPHIIRRASKLQEYLQFVTFLLVAFTHLTLEMVSSTATDTILCEKPMRPSIRDMDTMRSAGIPGVSPRGC